MCSVILMGLACVTKITRIGENEKFSYPLNSRNLVLKTFQEDERVRKTRNLAFAKYAKKIAISEILCT